MAALTTPPTLVILNPHAGSRRASRLWASVEPVLRAGLGDLELVITQQPQEVDEVVERALAGGLERVISIGGDGTNHSLVNALAAYLDRHPGAALPAFGMLPAGTGRDWARSAGIPFNPQQAAHWLTTAQPRPTDIGLLLCDGQPRHFLNIASVGLSGEVDRRVNLVRSRRPWTFLVATVATLIAYQPVHMRVRVDGQPWYEGNTYVVVVANGTTFGHGMAIAPNADIADGLFDVVLIEAMPRAKALAALHKVYDGSHLSVSGVHYRRAAVVEVASNGPPLDLDLDGEHATGHQLIFSVRPRFLPVLLSPSAKPPAP